jgi:serine/threonine protein kinase/formylglycine-generating enzyme required for sulfatase activity
MNEEADSRVTDPHQPTHTIRDPEAAPDSAPKQPASAPPHSESAPWQIDQYRIERLLGKGGFGCVYLAYDLKLQRHVAVKVPHRRLVSGPEDAELYLAEARTAAKLEHPHITQVYYVGSTDSYPFFSVSKFIEGCTLAEKIKHAPPSCLEAAELIAIIADTLDYAHGKGIFHRDVKPGNILLDKNDRPYLADFGLALCEEDVGTGWRHVGTPGYMSPEQARGEGHRVDGRADIFSLGVVFYELLVGRRPFRSKEKDPAKVKADLSDLVVNHDPRPPRQITEGIPKELERICLRALSKRAVDRYSTARDMAEELRAFLAAESTARVAVTPAGGGSTFAPATPASAPLTPAPVGGSSVQTSGPADSRPLRVVPKGPRSFDALDVDFFLELLPGPRDRDGLPESIRFWKTRIENHDSDQTFCVGLMYGPSGCGKTSLVKAGLLPRLAKSVIPIYCEASAADTETRLLQALRKRLAALAGCASLKEALATLRRGHGLQSDHKLLIVLDQFEQWLHANRNVRDSELVQALRQCDGGRVQCIVMVRDDFWLASSRFMRDLEIKLVEGQNSALVDLFDIHHARNVLEAFGRAYGQLPDTGKDKTRQQKEFLKQAVSELARGRKIVCVRLALFAEMIKDKPWTTATLKEVGGAHGVGVAFLEECLSSPSAPPGHRFHARAARSVLKKLLPESGSDIKGHMRSSADLLRASGYSNRQDFDDLIRILDSELRLITPVDPETNDHGRAVKSAEPADPTTGPDPRTGGEEHARISDELLPADPSLSSSHSTVGSHPTPLLSRQYQLSHDYLVPSLRDWLTRGQRETRRGRAELLLADRAAAWDAKSETRLLPGPWEWLNIVLLTRRRDRTPAQKRMMGRAGQYYVLRGMALAAVLIVAAGAVRQYLGQAEARSLRDRLLSATISDVPAIVNEMGPYRPWLDPLLRQSRLQAESDDDATKLLAVSLGLLPVDHHEVKYLYERLLDARPEQFAVIREALSPYKNDLLGGLSGALAGQAEPDRRFRAACALATYAPNHEELPKQSFFLVDKLLRENALVLKYWKDALHPVGHYLLAPLTDRLEQEHVDPTQRRMLAELYIGFAGPAQAEETLSKWQTPDISPQGKIIKARRLAAIGAALIASDRAEKVWPLLVHSSDPTLRSYLIERLGQAGAEPRLIEKEMNPTTDVSVRRALILALGSSDHALSPESLQRMRTLYEDDPDPGIHAAAGWLLRTRGSQNQVRRVDARLATSRPEGDRRWYVNQQHQTMVIIPAMSQPPPNKAIERDFAIGATEVTVDDIHKWKASHAINGSTAPSGDCPANSLSWYQAAEYCNWLSKEDNIPESQWCYSRNADGKFEKAPDSLKRTGYRLPTEAEWEFACRALSRTGWSCGEVDAELIGNYAWWSGNSQPTGTMRSSPVGTRKPNDFGLFDMHGNAYEWCHDIVRAKNKTPEPNSQQKPQVSDEDEARIRSGSFHQPFRNVRSDSFLVVGPSVFHGASGMRVARTLSHQ